MQYQDEALVCQENNCGKEFIWTSGEKKFMDGLLEDGKIKEITPPKRCESCRAKKRERFARLEQKNH